MTIRRRLYYLTAHHRGPFTVATMRHHRGYVILDSRTNRPAWIESHPHTGRPRALLVPTLVIALRVAETLNTTP